MTRLVQKDGGSNGLGTTDALIGVMSNFCSGLRQSQALVKRLGVPGYGSNTHGTAVGIGTIRFTAVRANPSTEVLPERVWHVTTSEMFEEVNKRLFVMCGVISKPPGDGQREHSIIGVCHGDRRLQMGFASK